MLDGLKVGNEALKKANEMFSIEEIEQIMEDTAESIEKQKEIDALISGQLTQEDENEVLEELEAMVAMDDKEDKVTEAEEENLELPEVPHTGSYDFRPLAVHIRRNQVHLLLTHIFFAEPSSAPAAGVKEKKRQKIALEAA